MGFAVLTFPTEARPSRQRRRTARRGVRAEALPLTRDSREPWDGLLAALPSYEVRQRHKKWPGRGAHTSRVSVPTVYRPVHSFAVRNARPLFSGGSRGSGIRDALSWRLDLQVRNAASAVGSSEGWPGGASASRPRRVVGGVSD